MTQLSTVKKVFAVTALLALLAACNTMQGAGRDIERTGEWIQKKADR